MNRQNDLLICTEMNLQTVNIQLCSFRCVLEEKFTTRGKLTFENDADCRCFASTFTWQGRFSIDVIFKNSGNWLLQIVFAT
jgi:hypothetical protein